MTGLGAFAEARAGSKREIMASRMVATDAGNKFSPCFLLRPVEPFGIAMPLSPEGSEKIFSNSLEMLLVSSRSLSSLISPLGAGLLYGRQDLL
jgi:hypothetical protein